MYNKGFTLIELLAVASISVILLAVAIPGYQSYITQSRRQEAVNILLAMKQEVEEYKAKKGEYPDKISAAGTKSTIYYNIKYDGDYNEYEIEARALGKQKKNDNCDKIYTTQVVDNILPLECR